MEQNKSDDQRVVSLNRYVKDMRPAVIQEIEAYWYGLRAGRAVPLRSEIDPRGIERGLEYAFILERIAPGLARFRLAGMHLNDLMGMEVRGMPFTSLFTPPGRKHVQSLLESVFNGPEIAEIALKAERSVGKPPLDAQLILLPLQSDLGDISRVLGCMVSNGAVGRTPRRFEVSATRMKRVSEATASPDTPKIAVPGFAEGPMTFSTPTGVARRSTRPHLRLVKDDD